MKGRSLGFKLGISFGLLISVFLSLGIFELARMGSINDDLNRIINRRWGKVELAREVLGYSNLNNRVTMGIFLLDTQPQIDPLLALRAEDTVRVSSLVKELEERIESTKERDLLASVKKARVPYTESYERSLDIFVNKQQQVEGRRAFVNETLPRLMAYYAAWNDYIDFEGNDMDLAVHETEVRYQAARGWVLILLAMAGVVGIFTAFFVIRGITKANLARNQAEHETIKLNSELEQKVIEETADLARANQGLLTEIAERKKAEAELLSVHAEAEQLLSSIASILIGVDAGGRVTRWNAAAGSTFGIPSETALGCEFKALAISWKDPGVYDHMRTVALLGRPGRLDDIGICDKNGKNKILGFTVHPIRGGNGKASGFVLLGVDLSERRHLEEQLQQVQKLEAIGELAAGIAHEINTPTQFIGDNIRFLRESWGKVTGVLDIVRKDSGTADARNAVVSAELLSAVADAEIEYLMLEVPKAIEQSLDGIQRVSQIVQAMRDFSHPGGAGKQSADINRAIRAAITVSRNEWKYVAEVETDLEPTLPLIQCIIGQFQQAILNLLINAAHAIGEKLGENSSQKGLIRVRTRQIADVVEIRVEDNGPGIPQKIRARVFEPFFTTKPVGKGTGQGLALVHTVIVQRHSGRIWIESEPGQGTTFVLHLPVGADPGKETVESDKLPSTIKS